jgi:hypothetical protein
MAAEELQAKQLVPYNRQSRCQAAANATLLPGKTHLIGRLWLRNGRLPTGNLGQGPANTSRIMLAAWSSCLWSSLDHSALNHTSLVS